MSNWFNRIINTGVNAAPGFEEKKKTKLLNIYCIVGIPTCLYLFIANYYNGFYLLMAIDVLLIAIALCYLIFNYKYHKFRFLRVVLLLASSLALATSAIYYHNEAENILLFNIILTYLIFNRKFLIYGLAAFNAFLFMLVKYFQHQQVHGTQIAEIPLHRSILATGIALFLIILCIEYFKNEFVKKLHNIEDAQRQLQAQQTILLMQKQELEETNNQLTSLNRTKEKLISVVAHDVKTPINSLKSLLNLFNQKYISKEEFSELIESVSSQVNHLQCNLDNLLQWSISQMNGIIANARDFNVAALLNEVITFLHTSIKNKKIKIDVICDDNLTAHADIDHVRLIINNLLTNAIKFSYVEGLINITVSENNNSIAVTIKDYGKGIEEHRLETLFSYSNDKSSNGTLNEKGTGVGLLLCKEFADKNGAVITYQSKLKEGSSFTIELPKTKAALSQTAFAY